MTSHLAHLAHALVLMTLELLLTAFLESFCMDEVQKLLQKKGGRELYRQAIVANVVNVAIFGLLTYWVSVAFACVPGPLTVVEQLRGMMGVFFIQGLLFYFIHKAFHEVKWLYPAHSFHHKFNDVVLPSSASAVSVTEFVVAYMFPIFASCVLVTNDRASAVYVSSLPYCLCL